MSTNKRDVVARDQDENETFPHRDIWKIHLKTKMSRSIWLLVN